MCKFTTYLLQCDEFINEYGKKIIQALVDGVGARAVCTIIHLCFGEERKFSVSDFKSSDCSACKIVLEFVKQILGEDFTKVCDYITHLCCCLQSCNLLCCCLQSCNLCCLQSCNWLCCCVH